jgi:flagellar biosynthesis GTPase FlhF
MTGLKRNRHNLGEIDRFLCPLVGTCLTLKETQKIARHFKYVGGASAYKLHIWIIEACRKLPAVAKHVQKFLDRKYRLTINRIDAVAGQGLNLVWQEALKEGQIAGAFYAITTRVDTPEDVMQQVFGDIHMMSHLQGAEARAELKEYGQLRQANEALQERVKRLTGQVERVKNAREEFKRQLSGKEAELADLGRKLAQLEENLISLNAGQELQQLRAANLELASRLNQEQRAREKLEMRLMKEAVRQIPGMHQSPAAQDPAPEATDSEGETCPLAKGDKCRRFCNKLILLVGGPERRESHYRRLVEQDFGGIFLRHDGDCRNGQARLVNMVRQAEVVICPISCTSHQAYHCVKKWCKKLNKPCVLMHNTGVGALTRTLMELAYPAGSCEGAEICET